MKTLKESFYEQLGSSRNIDNIVSAYGAVNSISLASEAAEKNFPREEYLEMYEDYQMNLQKIDSLEERLLEEWEGLPRVLRIGKAIHEEEQNENWLELFDNLPSSQRRQVTIIADWCHRKEGWRKDFDFTFRDETNRNLMILPETDEKDREHIYLSLKAMLIKLEKVGGGAVFHWYSGPEESFTKTTAAFAARPNCIYRVDASRARSLISTERTPEENEVFETAPLNLKISR